MSLLSVRDLSLQIGAHEILKGVSLDVSAGEIVAVTGESGSGKSLTALATLGLLPQGAQVQGEILFRGNNIAQCDEAALCDLRGREIGMVFQEPMTALNPVKTIGDQVCETILVHQGGSRAAARERAREVLERVGLPPERAPLKRFPHGMSGGQRQRVGIAMAIALRPRLLIADEPTTALDVTTQAQILELLRGLVREYDMGLLMITHDLAVVSDLADKITVMRKGEVVESGPTQALFARMQHPYTRALFRASTHAATMVPHREEKRVALLEVQGATRRYPLARASLFSPKRWLTAVNDVSFTLNKGDRVGLVGESGCGKSTLTRAILGLEPLQEGRISLAGQSVRRGAARRRGESPHVAQVVFQDPYGSFNPRHRVERLLCEPYHLVEPRPDTASQQRAVGEALEAVGLRAADAQKFIHEFSGGQRQRIAIARALITKPDLVIFDEAVSALDVQVRAQILDLIAEITGEIGLTYLFISHDLTVVRSITERVLVMRSGEIVEDGPTNEVLQHPSHPYTQALINAAPRLPEHLIAQAAAPHS